MKTRLLICIFLGIGNFSLLFAQVSFEERLEYTLKDGYENDKLADFGAQGFLVYSKKAESEFGVTEWKYDFFDQNLIHLETKRLFLDRKLWLSQSYSTQERIHLFFRDRAGNFSLVSGKISTPELQDISGTIPPKLKVREIAVLGDFVFLRGWLQKKPMLYTINWKTGSLKLLPIQINNFNHQNGDFLNFQRLYDSNELFLYVTVRVGKRKNNVYAIRLNDAGEQEEIFQLDQHIEQNLCDISASHIGDRKYIFTGTYSSVSTELAEGLFFSQYEDHHLSSIDFYSFMEMENFHSYLNERALRKLKWKKARKEAAGKIFNPTYHIASHEVIPLSDGYIFIGEAYYPTYSSACDVDGNFVEEFDGYQYTHAIIAKFDNENNLVWDEIFDMEPSYKPEEVKRFITISNRDPNFLNLVYVSGGTFFSKSIDLLNPSFEDSYSTNIQTGIDGDKFKWTNSDIKHWYGNYYIAHGRQKIKNELQKVVPSTRVVYFVNKLQYPAY